MTTSKHTNSETEPDTPPDAAGVATSALPPAMPRTAAVADRIETFAVVDSTNVRARHLLSEGALEELSPQNGGEPMIVVAADLQRSGHGRLGRFWFGRPGDSFMVSFATALPRALATDPGVNGWVQMAAGIAAIDALRDALGECGASTSGESAPLQLKWPNDIFCDGHKLGGILCELVPLGKHGAAADSADSAGAADMDDLVGVVVGVGINLRVPADRLPTAQSTSLHFHYPGLAPTGPLRDDIAAAMVTSLRESLHRLCEVPREQMEQLHTRVLEESYTLGRRVEVKLADGGIIRGEALSVNADASLTVRDAEGAAHVVTTGDVGVLPV